ncbi:hypothetical protein [Pseudoalteromonas byunsanensis]|uniref:Uncharacterized protein n=1 Tax=Pseudoalteromonas byunsanensis TaxID=327939 RepID=A0A1S1N8F1_9GAMM|nr:hypothetical protein [Pseudoalteromonas byunsanensis]OHU95936.1 hypothetical protein BIW53_09025 [Pseudoalteromonas byunsanensis]
MKFNLQVVCMGIVMLMLCSAFNASARPSMEVDLILPCHGCSDSQKRQVAANAAYTWGQKIYIADRSRSGSYTVQEYHVAMAGPAMASGSSVTLRRTHSASSPLGSELKTTDIKTTIAMDKVTGSFQYQDSDFKSAFDAVRMSSNVFADWLADYHAERFSDEFSVIDSEFAKFAAKGFGLSLGVISVGLSDKEMTVVYTFADATKVEADVDLSMMYADSSVRMRFKNLKFKDKKGMSIPKSKYGLERYLGRIGTDIDKLEERGEPESISDHLREVFSPNYSEYDGGDGNGGGAGGLGKLACVISEANKVKVVTCYWY